MLAIGEYEAGNGKGEDFRDAFDVAFGFKQVQVRGLTPAY
jgi:hypothetical protein